MQCGHGRFAIHFATFCAVNDRDFRPGRAYIHVIKQPGHVAPGFKDKDNAVHLQQAELRTDRLERRSPQEPVPRAQHRHGRAARPARLHPHTLRRLTFERDVRSARMQRRLSPGGGVFYCLYAAPETAKAAHPFR